jgi:hypothetical protein
MPEYRLYLKAADGRILGPAIIIECDNDQEAFDRASRTANGKALELWQGSRPILQLPADE